MVATREGSSGLGETALTRETLLHLFISVSVQTWIFPQWREENGILVKKSEALINYHVW